MDKKEIKKFKRGVKELLREYENPGTHRIYEQILGKYLEYCLVHDINALKAKRVDLQEYGTWLIEKRGLKPSSANTNLKVVKVVYAFLADEGFIKVNPAARLNRIKVAEQRQPYLKQHAMMQFLEASEKSGPKHHAIACLMMLSGLRVSEVCSIRVEDIVHNKGLDEIKVLRKGTKTHYISLAPRTAFAIKEHLKGRQEGFLFYSNYNNPLNSHAARRSVNRVKRAAGIDARVTPHALRRSGITAALHNGVPITDVQHWAGHADPRTTSRYDQRRHETERRTALILQGILSD